jgi:exodeoxyribonuclease VII large subunit
MPKLSFYFVNLFQTSIEDFSTMKSAEIVRKLDLGITQKDSGIVQNFWQLQNHKSVAVRRKLVQFVSEFISQADLEKLQNWQKKEPDRQTWIKIETAIDRLHRKQDFKDDVGVLTVSEVMTMIKAVVAIREYTVKGEISESSLYGNLYYFKLKGEDSYTMDCMCLSTVLLRAGFPLNTGIEVKLTGRFKIGAKNSRLYFQAEKIQLTGEGQFLRDLKILEEKLKSEGLLDETRKRKLLSIPKKILLIASPDSAAILDFKKVIDSRRGGVEIFLLPIKTQGSSAERVILEAFSSVNNLVKKHDIDTVVLTRGGGSKEDLIVFNSEKVVRALHGFSCPTIVAIGHERDVTLVELVADMRAATPSQAAELASKSNTEILNNCREICQLSANFCKIKTQKYQTYTNQIISIIFNKVGINITTTRKQLVETTSGIDRFLYLLRQEINNKHNSIIGLVQRVIDQQRLVLEKVENLDMLIVSRAHETRFLVNNSHIKLVNLFIHRLSDTRSKLDVCYISIQKANPEKILALGYCYAGQDGNWVKEKKYIDKQKPLTITFLDGAVSMGIEK